MPAKAVWGQDSMKIDMELQLPPVELQVPPLEHKVDHRVEHTVEHRIVHTVEPGADKVKKKVVRKQGSQLSGIFQASRPLAGSARNGVSGLKAQQAQRLLEPVYFQSFDCVGIPNFLSAEECKRIIAFSEEQGFSVQRRHRLLNLEWSDVIDPFFCEALWGETGLGEFLQQISVDGMVPCGLNDVVRIQKFVPGSAFGRHTDKCIHRVDGRISKYSLRVFLTSPGNRDFEGGLSHFHPPFRQEPVRVEPETGLAMLYPQGEQAIPQEEGDMLSGCKYVLRADVLFTRPERWK